MSNAIVNRQFEVQTTDGVKTVIAYTYQVADGFVHFLRHTGGEQLMMGGSFSANSVVSINDLGPAPDAATQELPAGSIVRTGATPHPCTIIHEPKKDNH